MTESDVAREAFHFCPSSFATLLSQFLFSMVTNDVHLQAVSLFVLLIAFQVAGARLSLQSEAKRRWLHALTGVALVQVSYYLPLKICIATLLVATLGIWYLKNFQNKLFHDAFGPLLRPSERESLPGAFYFLIGTIIAALLLPMQTARYAVECLSLADPRAAWVGQSVSSPRIHKSASVAGCLACFVTAWFVGWLLLRPEEGAKYESSIFFWKITAGALACCIAEALPFGNDNVAIPILTGMAVEMVR
jgi:dolichol kinase